MNILKKCTFGISLFLLSLAATCQTYKPQIKVTKGQEYNYSIQMNSETVQSMGGQEMKFTANQDYTLKNNITDVKPDGKVETLTSNWDAKITAKIMKDTTISLNGKVGSSTHTTFDKFGNILSKVKIDTVMQNTMGANFDNNMISNALFVEFPENLIKTGDKWTKDYSDSVDAAGLGGKLGLKVKTEYELGTKEKIEGKDLYKVTYNSTMEVAGKGVMQGMNLFVEGTGMRKGELYFYPASGVISSNIGNLELDMTIAVSGQQSMTIPVTQKMTITQRLKM
jgi:hypothetical protein